MTDSSEKTDFEQPFREFWATTLYPRIQPDYERLLKTTPTRIAEKQAEKQQKEAEKKDNKKKRQNKKKEEKQEEEEEAENEEEADPCIKKIAELIEEVRKKGERRTTYLNLAWTGPIDNSFLQSNISLGKVRNMAADMFLRNLPTGETAEPAPSSEEAVPDAEVESQGNVERGAVEILTEKKKAVADPEEG